MHLVVSLGKLSLINTLSILLSNKPPFSPVFPKFRPGQSYQAANSSPSTSNFPDLNLMESKYLMNL